MKTALTAFSERLSEYRLRPRRPKYRSADHVAPILTLISLVALWELVTVIFRIPGFLLPAPSTVGQQLWEWRADLPGHIWVTTFETLAGFGLSVAVGVPLAVAIVSSRFLQRTIYPLLVVAQSIPKIAIAPLLVVWLGFDALPKILVTFLVCLFPIVVDTASGLDSVQPELLDLMRSMTASKWQILMKIRFPSALPQFFSGLKVAITLAVIGAVIGEFVGGNAGLGYLVLVSTQYMNTGLAFGAIVLLAALSLVLFFSITKLEEWLVPWASEDTD